MTVSLSLIDPAREYRLKQVLKNVESNNDKETYWLTWRGERRLFTVIRVETQWVLLSLDNGRTKAEQEVVAAEANDPALFADPLSPDAQKAQAQILKELDLPAYKDLLKDLEQRRQREPGVLTAAGVLVNGNRRCVALRELGEEYMSAVVLPADATPREIRALEVELQIAKDFREEYSDINRLLMIERLMQEDGYSPEQVASRFRLSVKEVVTDRGILALMRDYLGSVAGIQRLGNLNGTYQAFKEAYEEIAELQWAGQYQRAAKLKSARFLGILAGAGYRELRHVGEDFCQRYALPTLEKEPDLKAIMLDAAEPPSEVELGPLSDFLSGTGEVDHNAPLFQKMIKLGADHLANAAKGNLLNSSYGRIKEAIKSAAQDAQQDAKDEKNSTKPSLLMEEATSKILKISLEKAIASGNFDNKDFERRLMDHTKALNALTLKFSKLRGDI